MRKAPPTLKAATSFSIVVNDATELNWCDSSAEVANLQAVRKGEMSVDQIRELEKMTQELVTVARRLPHGRERETVLQEIREFRAKIAALKGAAGKPKAKGK